MNEREKDSIYYFCSLIEFIGRVTKNRRSDVISIWGAAISQTLRSLLFIYLSVDLIFYLGGSHGDSIKDEDGRNIKIFVCKLTTDE